MPVISVSLSKLILYGRLFLFTVALILFVVLGTKLASLFLSFDNVFYGQSRSPFKEAAIKNPAPTKTIDYHDPPMSFMEGSDIFKISRSIDAALETKFTKASTQGRLLTSGQESGIDLLQLKLLGTVAGPTNLTYAVILDVSVGEERAYKVSDKIKGAKILSVEPMKVLLLYEGKREYLRMEFFKEQQNWVFKKETKKDVNLKSYDLHGRPKNQAMLIKLDRARLGSALSNLDKTIYEATLMPAFKAGHPNGYIIINIKDGSIFDNLGLKNGDVLQKIDGQPIKSNFSFLAFLPSLKEKALLNIDLERGFSPLSLSVRLE